MLATMRSGCGRSSIAFAMLLLLSSAPVALAQFDGSDHLIQQLYDQPSLQPPDWTLFQSAHTSPIYSIASVLLGSNGTSPAQHPHLSERSLVRQGALYPPAVWFDINNLTSLAQLSQLMVTRMQTWYRTDQAPNYIWTQAWQVPLLGIALADLDLAFGNSANKDIVSFLANFNDANNFVFDDWIDDQSWWGMFGIRAYQAYGNSAWLAAVQGLIVANNNAYTPDCGGGILWKLGNYYEKNTITNTLHFSILSRLHRFTGVKSYYTDALATLDWWLGWAFESDTGKVWDSIQNPGCLANRTGLQSWTYNSGVVLFGLADMYHITGDESLLDLGRTIAYAAMRDFSAPGTAIVQESCEHFGPQYDGGPSGCGDDFLGFKGALVMGMAELYAARPDPVIYNFINTQLLSVVWNNLDDTWLAGPWWTGPFNESTAGPKTQLTAICLLAAAATINVNFITAASRAPGTNSTAVITVPLIVLPSAQASTADQLKQHSSTIFVLLLITFGLLVL